ncbi:L-serine ammonia-lyase, iron-sulfur-dependent, subunit alpha [Schaalia vaccimaxillae]|uniref:L-serine ammonia-lyase, iron-sulfur-dependent, subunit alpha n=1 Tax=Schaalia vaccimaxillae TaxID=183916 RepID=UPI0003B5A8E5|nr:L-serine ammonia-lyase, iron-sulfur-dependent, subunit alpha [Schaalia vaccimaxillae]
MTQSIIPATPADLISGKIAATNAPHPLSVFDMFRIGIGPSSSHTVGPMRAGLHFTTQLAATTPSRITIDLYGSLAATGIGHNTDRAVLLGIAGHHPETVTTHTIETLLATIATHRAITLPNGARANLDPADDIRFHARTVLPYHVNALTITAYEGDPAPETTLLQHTYYSVGGGFVMIQTNADPHRPEVAPLASTSTRSASTVPAPHPFATAEQLLKACAAANMSISDLVRTNEESARPRTDLDNYLDRITNTMFDCIDAGTQAHGILPGGLDVPRRAAALARKLGQRTRNKQQIPTNHWASTPNDPMRAMDWVNLYALAVNEENAAGHRIVTAPTNGAAGVIPAVLGYLVTECPEAGALGVNLNAPPNAEKEDHEASTTACESTLTDSTTHQTKDNIAPLAHVRLTPESPEYLRRSVHNFLLAASAIGALIKTNASIAGAEVGCQGEVGSACAMAAAGLAQALGGTPSQVENAAEIAMEHSLGLTCDPVGGLVQIPCIERNAIAAVKAINAARMAMWGDGRHTVSLDAVIETMRQTGNDMLSKYKETSEGGLAVNVVEC